MLIAEDLLLLLTDDDTGELTTSGTLVDIALGGALLVELAVRHRVDVAGAGDPTQRRHLVVRDTASTDDEVLDDALREVVAKRGKKPEAVVTALGRGARLRLYERLSTAGVLREEKGRVLGLFPMHHWPTQKATDEAEVRAAIVTAMKRGAVIDARTGALIALLSALDVVHKVMDAEAIGISRHDMEATALRIAEADWAAGAVRSAVDTLTAAIIAASASVVVAGSG